MAFTPAKNGDARDSWVVFEHSQGAEIGRLLRFTRHIAVFETYAPSSVLRMSEVLAGFKILLYGQTAYAGRGVIRNLIHAGVAFVVEVTLDGQWTDVTRPAREMGVAGVESGFVGFLRGWQRVYRVLPEFKVVVADLHAFLSDLRLWMDQRELGVTSNGSDLTAESAVGELRSLQNQAVDAINLLHERFEEIAEDLDEEMLPGHEHFARRHLHPLVLCSPFGHRAYQKPLGYAGDYEMVNMILRSPYEGESWFAQVMNLWLLKGPPSVAHRNRIDYLVALLEREVLRCQIRGETCRVLSIGCGPAHEIQRFLASGRLADGVRFELIDMNEETLAHVASALEAVKLRFSRRTVVETRKRTVMGLLRDAARSTPGSAVGCYDFIYCAGLFDYLTDGACRQLLKACWDWLAPGGLLLATNVDTFRPFRHMLEILLDWHLTYRNQAQLRGLVPVEIPADGVSVASDATGVNLFLQLRRPGGRGI